MSIVRYAPAGALALVIMGLLLSGCAKAPAEAEAAKSPVAEAKTDEPAGDSKTGEASVVYPVVTQNPVPRSFNAVVRAFGTAVPDVRTARTVATSTVVDIRSVAVLPGERVRRGQALFTVGPDPLAFLAYQQASSALTFAKAEVARLRAQYEDRLATATQLETAEKASRDAQAAMDAARRQGADAGVVVLRSPVDGIVTAVGAAIGDRPAPGTVLAAIAPASGTHITLGVEPDDVALVHVGDKVTVTSIATRRHGRTGHVELVGASLDKEMRLVPVSVQLDAAAGDWLSGMAVEGAIATQSVAAYALPRTAVIKDEVGPGVWEVVDGKAHHVPVVIVAEEGARVGVTGELDAKRPVVTSGAYELENGVAVSGPKP